MNRPPSLRVQLATIVTVVSFLLATMAPVTASARPTVPKAPAKPDKPVSKTQSVSSLVQGSNAGGTFYGVVSVVGFAVNTAGVLVANGTFNGVVTLAGKPPQSDVESFSVPVAAIDPSCNILTLTLGPLFLNLLGLQVTLNQVNLTITAIPGAGNLLGNLLCDVANLLNPGSLSGLSTLLTNLVNVLNQILQAL